MGMEGRVAIVTGAGQGLGRAYARRLADEGASVVVADINSSSGQAVVREITAGGGRASFEALDVRSEESCQAIAQATLDSYGRIDVLVNNAAFASAIVPKPFMEIPIEEWDDVMAVNARGVWLVTRAVVPAMQQAGYGRIINVASGLALHGGSGTYFHYIASKGAVLAMTRALARTLGPFGITVNTIAPGSIETEVWQPFSNNPDAVKPRLAMQSVKRLGTPEDLASVVAFLASEDSGFLTGQAIPVDGGVTFVQ
jgi:3-oxoacyl-[acyl-carrier protein] reductase